MPKIVEFFKGLIEGAGLVEQLVDAGVLCGVVRSNTDLVKWLIS